MHSKPRYFFLTLPLQLVATIEIPKGSVVGVYAGALKKNNTFNLEVFIITAIAIEWRFLQHNPSNTHILQAYAADLDFRPNDVQLVVDAAPYVPHLTDPWK